MNRKKKKRKKKNKKKHSTSSSAVTASQARTVCPTGHFLFFTLSRDWWAQNRPFTDWNQISVMRPAAMNGSHAGGCRREGVCLSPPHVISARWPCPRRHQRVVDVICSHSAVTWRNGNQWRQRLQRWPRRQREGGREGSAVTEREWAIWSDHVFIYLTRWPLAEPVEKKPSFIQHIQTNFCSSVARMWRVRSFNCPKRYIKTYSMLR